MYSERILTLGLVFVLFAGLCFCRKETLKIGAIFDSGNEQQINAFKQAILDASTGKYQFQEEIEEIEYNNPFQAMKAICSLLENGVVGVLGPLSEENSNMVQSICDAKEIPHIDVRWDDYPLNGTIVNVHPYPDMLTETYVDMLEAWGWEDFIILYENNESLQRVGELLKRFDPKGHQVVLKQLHSVDESVDNRKLLKQLWRSGATHFMIDCSVELLNMTLRQAQQVGLMTDQQHYIIVNLDFHTLNVEPYLYSDTNITGMRFIDPDDTNLQEIASQIHNEDEGFEFLAGWKLRLQEALTYDAIMMFGEAVNTGPKLGPAYISCYNDNDTFSSGTSIVNFMKNLQYPGLTGKIMFDRQGFRTDFGLDIIELKEGGITTVGTWNSDKSPRLNITRIIQEEPDSQQELYNKSLVVITTLTEPYGMRKISTEKLSGNDRYEGFAIDLIHELSLMRGFNYTFIIRDDKANGNFDNKTGKWSGMIGDVVDGRADLAITDLTITYEREQGVDFTSPFMMLGIGILYQKPTKAPPSFFSFADPFAFEVWRLLMAACVGVSFVLFILGRISPSEWENPYPCIEEPEYLVNQMDLRNCFWFMTGAILQQGSEIELKSIAVRMVAGMWWFFTLLMVSSYTANLAAFLTTENPDPHFTNLNELVKNAEEKGIKYGCKLNGATENFFRDKAKQDPDSDFAKVYEHMQKYKDEVLIKENEHGVEKAMKERYAFFMESSSIQYEIQRKCNLNQVGGSLDEKGYGIAMRKNSPYRGSLSTAILILQNSGRIEDIKRKWWEERRGGGQCNSEDSEGEATPLNLKNVEGVFWVTIGGTVFASFLAVVETISYLAKKSMRMKMPFKEALKEEIFFYFKFGEMVKPAIKCSSSAESGSKKSLEKSDEQLSYHFINDQNSMDTLENGSIRSKKSKSNPKRLYKQNTNQTY